MRKFLILIMVFVGSNILRAQAPEYSDLLILYADGNYKKLIREATKYTEKEATSKDPNAWLWLGKGLYKISFVGDRDEEFKNAYKDALNALGKCRKADKDGAVFEKNREFFDEVKASVMEVISNDISGKDYKKAAGWVTRIYKLSPDDIGAKYLEGACKFQNADKGGANATWKEAETLMSKVKSVEDFSKTDMALIQLGVFETVECYVKSRQMDKAKALLNKVAPWFEGDEEFKAKYDAVVN
jgi:tetratricopeptide (TPR) repeat protein